MVLQVRAAWPFLKIPLGRVKRESHLLPTTCIVECIVRIFHGSWWMRNLVLLDEVH